MPIVGTMAEFNRDTFFHDIATNLRDKGALKPYAQPEGVARQTDPKIPMATHPLKSVGGQVMFTGDAPYQGLAHRVMGLGLEQPLTQEEINLKRGSIMRAIMYYVPHEKMQQYLEHFIAHIDDNASYHAAVESVLKNANSQLRGGDGNRVSMEDTYDLIKRRNVPDLVGSLSKSEACVHAEGHPDLIVAAAIFQAAHLRYLTDLQAAIDKLDGISEQEREIADYTINNTFSEFRQFQIFSIFVPMVYLKLAEMMREAWQHMFDPKTSMFEMKRRPDSSLPEKEGDEVRVMQCPAQAYLRKMIDGNAIEKIYDAVANDPSHFESFLGEAKRISNRLAGAEASPVR